MTHVVTPYDDAPLITPMIDSFNVKRIFVNGGTSMNILFLDAFETIKRYQRGRLVPDWILRK